MGIDADAIVFLQHARELGVDFSRLCTVGRQRLSGEEFADDFLRSLGALDIDSLDASPYEGATIVHDLNSSERPRGCEQRFTTVLDGGSLEHVFHVPNALATMMSLVSVGGHLLAMNPTDGQSGHGFYQFSPDFWFAALSPVNGFEMEQCLLKERGRHLWFEVASPDTQEHRLELPTRGVAYLYVIARRVAVPPPLLEMPQQHHYEQVWAGHREMASRRRSFGFHVRRILGRTRARALRRPPAGFRRIEL